MRDGIGMAEVMAGAKGPDTRIQENYANLSNRASALTMAAVSACLAIAQVSEASAMLHFNVSKQTIDGLREMSEADMLAAIQAGDLKVGIGMTLGTKHPS